MSDIYHVLSRGVDKRKIFLDKRDYLRFIHNLFVLNNQKIVYTTHYNLERFENQSKNVDIASPHIERELRKLLVNILAFCLMPNHYHLLLSSLIENGIPRFMKKLNMAYAKYFNIKYKRKGTLFESRYKSILVSNDAHFYHLPYYIHLNPLDMEFPEWRNREIRDYNKAIEFLNNHRWSSHLDYCGKKNFPSITNREFLLDVFGGEEKYKKDIHKWLQEMEINSMRDLVLE